MKSIASHLSIALVALVAGGVGAAALSQGQTPRPTTVATAPPRPLPPQVRTVVVTRTIHRVRHVHAKPHRRTAPAAAPPPVRVAPAAAVPVARVAPVAAAPVTHVTTHTSSPAAATPVAPTHVTTHTSGGGGASGGGDGEGGGDSGDGGGHDD